VPRKNVGLLIKAFAQAELPSETGLVLSGADDTEEARTLRSLVSSLGIENRVVFTGYLTNAELAAIYSEAAVFALPSLYEGFGMILLEAMSAGVPIVCANSGALPEVLGDAGLLFSPDDIRGAANAIRAVIADENLALDLVARGHRRRSDFSWRHTAERTLSLYRRLAADRREPNRRSQ
jgi:glycosyltransferase involved in cell wall biosynthesis